MPGAPREPLPAVLEFMQRLWALVHALEARSKRMVRDVGVTGPQRLVLRVVGLYPGISAGEVAALLHVHPSTLTGVLRRLAAQRLVVRTADPADRRRAVLRLSARGRRANATSAGTAESEVARALEGIPRRDLAATRRVLGRVTERLRGQQDERW